MHTSNRSNSMLMRGGGGELTFTPPPRVDQHHSPLICYDTHAKSFRHTGSVSFSHSLDPYVSIRLYAMPRAKTNRQMFVASSFIKPGRRVKLNRSQAVNVHKVRTIRFLHAAMQFRNKDVHFGRT